MSQLNNDRIFKNTIALYGRTLFMLVISLITSRITLQALGVDNYGIQNVVGGIVTMFSVISGSLSKSISRFITFELGHGDKEKLQRIFATAINVQLLIGSVIILIGETIGVWFLNTQMNIPADRMTANQVSFPRTFYILDNMIGAMVFLLNCITHIMNEDMVFLQIQRIISIIKDSGISR